MTKVKICGLRRLEDVEYVNRLRPDFVGFVFAPASRRFVSCDFAAELKDALDSNISAVGVFVDAPLRDVVSLVERHAIDMIQLHGFENDEYIAQLRALCSVPVIQAFSVSKSEDVERVRNSKADFVLLDNGSGGTGATFDWSLASEIGRPFFLAGGLSPDNVSRAISLTKPFAVDVSSGVEVDGVKNFEKIRDVITLVRNADGDL